MKIILTITLAIATLLAPAAWAQQSATPPDPQVVMAQAISDLQDRVAGLEKDTATKKELAALRTQQTADRSRFAEAIYRIAGESEPSALGRTFSRNPRNNAGHLLTTASDTAKKIGAQASAPAAPAPAAKPAEPAPAPAAQAAPAPPPAVAAPSDRDRDLKVADEIERLIGGLSGLVRALRQ